MLMQNRTRVLVIGLDGGTWNIIKPLVDEGKLPTIEGLMKRGCYGDLESCIPPITFPAWKCYSTGKNPGKLGVYFYLGVDMAKQEFVVHNSTSFKSKELWDYLGENNITCGLLDMPTTHPCRPIKGFMISHGSPRSSGYTYPPELERELIDRFAYKIEPEYSFDFGKAIAISSMKSLMRERFAVARYLWKKFTPSFFHLTIFNIDQIQHNCWREMEKRDVKYGKVIEECWILIDSEIGRLLEECYDEDTYILLMSDHGFTGNKGIFQMDRWLAERDLLKLKKSQLLRSGLLFRLGLSRANLIRTLGKFRPVLSLLRSLIPKETRQKMAGLFPNEARDFGPNTTEASVDWERTKVTTVAEGLYINRNALNSEEEYDELRDSLITEIGKIENPETGEKLAQEVYKREEIYLGKYVDRAPDITILAKEGHAIYTQAQATGEWFYPRDRWTGTHKREGIFLACGPGMKRGVEIQGARIYDLAPTILHLFDLPIPKDIDGRVLKEIFEEDSSLAKKEIKYQEAEERARVKDKIKELKDQGKI
jgi:predicted AlkP superfamily phosphohydrolase/phosphomutase